MTGWPVVGQCFGAVTYMGSPEGREDPDLWCSFHTMEDLRRVPYYFWPKIVIKPQQYVLLNAG